MHDCALTRTATCGCRRPLHFFAFFAAFFGGAFMR
jgi:hypothetical protein